MRKLKECLILVLVFALAVSSVACGHTNSLSSPSAVQTGTIATDLPENEKIKLKLWHIWVTDSDSNKRPFEKVLAEWNNANPNIQIEAEAAESEAYKVKIRTAIAVNEAPDIFFSWGAGFAKPFVNAGKVLALDDYLDEEILDKMVPGSLENFTYDGKIYALPTFMIAGIFFCNRELFDKYDVKIPDTFDELLEAVRIFKENNITPMAVGLKDGWPGIFYQNILAIRTAGIEKTIAALNKETTFYQPEFIESAQKLVELIEAGAFHSGSSQLTQYEAENHFIRGLVPMYYCGNWSAGSMERMSSPVRGKVVAKNFPYIEGAGGNKNGFLGGAIDNFMISSSTQYKEEAVTAMIEICQNLSRESYLAGAGLPAWKVDVDRSEISPLTAQISDLIKDSEGFVLAWDTFLTGSDAQTHIELVSDIYAGKLTPERFAIEMQKLNINP